MKGHSRKLNWDANACRGLLPEVRLELDKYMADGLNPSSIHSGGQKGKGLIEAARTQLLSLLSSPKDARVIFSSGATESNNAICYSVFWQHLTSPQKLESFNVITSEVEHPSILEPLLRLESLGVKVKRLTPQQIPNVCDYIDSQTALVTIMSANNETGHIFNLSEKFAQIKLKYPSVIIHSDMVQSLAKQFVDFNSLHVDALTISAHKIGGLSGVGALVLKKHVTYNPFITGGAQELRFRAGTENLVGIISLGLAAKQSKANLQSKTEQMNTAKVTITRLIEQKILNAKILFKNENTLPNTLSVHFPGIKADDLVVALDLEGIYCSSGSACASGKPLASHVLMAYGLSEQEAKEVIRISLTGDDSLEELEAAVDLMSNCVNRIYKCSVNIERAA